MTALLRPARDFLQSPDTLIRKELSRLEKVLERGIRLLEETVRARLAIQTESAELSTELRRVQAEKTLLGDPTPARLSPGRMRRRLEQIDRRIAQCRERERLIATVLSQAESARTSLKREAAEIEDLWRRAHDLTRTRLLASGLIADTAPDAWTAVPPRTLADMGEGEVALYATTASRLRIWRRRVVATASALQTQLRRRT